MQDSFATEESPVNTSTVSAGDVNITPKGASKRRLTPKQLLKMKESEKKRLERQKQKNVRKCLFLFLLKLAHCFLKLC